MPADDVMKPWAVRSTLIAVSDLDRSVAFYSGLGPLEVVVRDDGLAVLSGASPDSLGVILRQTLSNHPTRHGPQSLGLRFITFNVGSLGELDRIESHLRTADLFTARQDIGQGASNVIVGRDPDNLPLVFAYYARETLQADYYQSIATLIYALDT